MSVIYNLNNVNIISNQKHSEFMITKLNQNKNLYNTFLHFLKLKNANINRDKILILMFYLD